MRKRQTITVAVVCMSFALASCSVGMALSGKKDPNLGMIRQGSTRGEVELELGTPTSSVTHEDGKRTDAYEYELGNEPSTGRAIAWGVLDVFTLGLWELAGTPIEALQGTKYRMTILYGPDNRVISINQVPAPPVPGKKEGEPAPEGHAAAVVPKSVPDTTAATGTCFTVSPNGVLLTAYHLIKNAKYIRVHLADGTTTEAKLQTFNAKTDLAILRIDLRTPHYLSLAPDESVRVGERVFTMGYPAPDLLGQEPKFTEGSISALSGPGGAAGLLQVSVPVQPGNSGGPLINEHGRVVGVISSTAGIQAFLSATGALPQNVNWAIKADYARALFDAPTPKSVRVSREETVKDVREALCMVEASSR
jgi:S1-C subfamily serine protease